MSFLEVCRYHAEKTDICFMTGYHRCGADRGMKYACLFLVLRDQNIYFVLKLPRPKKSLKENERKKNLKNLSTSGGGAAPNLAS